MRMTTIAAMMSARRKKQNKAAKHTHNEQRNVGEAILLVELRKDLEVIPVLSRRIRHARVPRSSEKTLANAVHMISTVAIVPAVVP